MAPGPFNVSPESASAPLADYFFISGIESSQVFDEKAQTNGIATPSVEVTIEEDRALEAGPDVRQTSLDDFTNPDGFQLPFRSKDEARKSGSSTFGVEPKQTPSNRSSTTIKGVQIDSGSKDSDFENALLSFSSERETFIEEIQSNSTTVTQQAPPRPRPRTQRIADDVSGGRSAVGSIRKRISTIGSLKRQPSFAGQSSIRTSKRLSGYNSVIPAPQPFNINPNMHPLKRRYEPVLLDRYPPKNMVDELKRRNPFPDYIPMFAFPGDAHVVSSDHKPRSTWHGFVMTNSDDSKLYGICVIIWIPLNPRAAEGLERQCEEWRRANMTGEERELASSLGERLAMERAKLSRLLAQLPTVPSGSEEREQLEDSISSVEENITIMNSLLKPVRHGAASKIDGLTDGESGLWIPRAYGVLGRDASLTSFWKEWLKAVIVPMANGGILRVPPISPRNGMWQPLERYVVNLCAEALNPISSVTQVEVFVGELRMFARKEAANELPGSRNTDLYAIFRALSIPNIVTLFEYVLTEKRIILLSAYTAMLHLASAALISLLYPLKWAGVFIPVLPFRLIQALDAPVPYIMGIEKRYESSDFPEENIVVVDLDNNSIESTERAVQLPRQQRRKLMSLLQLAASHHNRFGVPKGPPVYAQETFPNDAFSSENSMIFSPKAPVSTLSTYVAMNSTSFGAVGNLAHPSPAIFNAFLQSRNDQNVAFERPSSSSTWKTNVSPPSRSPISGGFHNQLMPISRSDSGFALQVSLREKRSGHFDTLSRRSSSFGLECVHTLRRPSQSFLGHQPSWSTSSLGTDVGASSSYAPSVYAQSTLAASTVIPETLVQSVHNSNSTQWIEGHCLQLRPRDEKMTCSICDEKSDEDIYSCNACRIYSHGRCLGQIYLVCPAAFSPDQVRASFVRCFASLFYTYRRYMHPATGDQKKSGMLFKFDMDRFLKSMPRENAEYMMEMCQSQGFIEFIHDRESKRMDDPSIKLFDQIILSKKNRGRSSIFSKSSTDFLSDTSEHRWQSAVAMPPNSRFPGDYAQVISRSPSKLDPMFMKEPRSIQGMPRVSQARARRKPIPSLQGL